MDRYGEAIEYDLHERLGLDLLDFFRGRYSWRKLDDLISRLPRASAFGEARLMDPEYAEQALDQAGSSSQKQTPPIAGYTQEVELLTDIGEMLQAIRSVLEKAHYGESPRWRPWPRPETAFDAIEQLRSIARRADLLAEVTEAQTRYAHTHPSEGGSS